MLPSSSHSDFCSSDLYSPILWWLEFISFYSITTDLTKSTTLEIVGGIQSHSTLLLTRVHPIALGQVSATWAPELHAALWSLSCGSLPTWSHDLISAPKRCKQSHAAEVPLAFSQHCPWLTAFCYSVSFAGNSVPVAVPFMSAQEGGELGGAATTTGWREGRAPALLHSAALLHFAAQPATHLTAQWQQRE